MLCVGYEVCLLKLASLAVIYLLTLTLKFILFVKGCKNESLLVIYTSESNGQIIGFPFAERKIEPPIFRIRFHIFWAFGRIICMG